MQNKISKDPSSVAKSSNSPASHHSTATWRPTSPHITIYKPQINSVISIMHRISGLTFMMCLIFIVLYTIFYTHHTKIPCELNQHYAPTLLCKTFLFITISSLSFHMICGIRYIFWYMLIGTNKKAANTSGVIILCLFSIISTLFIIYLARG